MKRLPTLIDEVLKLTDKYMNAWEDDEEIKILNDQNELLEQIKKIVEEEISDNCRIINEIN